MWLVTLEMRAEKRAILQIKTVGFVRHEGKVESVTEFDETP